MRILCAGFNLYGQFSHLNDSCVETFTTIDCKNVLDIQISHTFSFIKMKEKHFNKVHNINEDKIKIYFHGFVNNETHQITELDFKNDDIIKISVSNNGALCLSASGKIWNLVFNDEKFEYDLNLLPDFTKIEQGERERDDKVIDIACGQVINCAYSKYGNLYNIPSKLNFQHLKVIDMCCGREHCLILTEDGFVFSFGGGSRGQLGHGDVEDQLEPRLIEALAGIKIVKICCGAWHSAALSADGDLYTWGWNSNGQLGLKTDESNIPGTECVAVMASPHFVNFDLNVLDVESGARHIIALLENGKLYGAGWNKYCQLGFKNSEENFYKMTFLHDFSNEEVSGLRCGPWNSAVLVND